MSERWIRRAAGERSYRNRFSATHNGVLEDPDRIDADGVRGEEAFAAAFGIARDVIETKRPVRFNFQLADGTRVDVRTSRHRDAALIVPPRVAGRATIDVYVLAVIDERTDRVTLRGWATRAEVRAVAPERISRLPNATPVHRIYPWNLRPIDELLAHHQARTLRMPGL